MITYIQFQRKMARILAESSVHNDPNTVGHVSPDTQGKLHEILVGKHLNGGDHMTHHVNKAGETPKETHDRLRQQIHPSDYERINKSAKSAADHIKSHQIGKTHPGHQIHSVIYTSKEGDTERVTGHKATQAQDSSDIYVSTKHPKTGEIVHHGISLKVSETTKHVPVSNPGIEHAGSKTPAALDNHRKSILAKYPELKGMKNKAERKAHVKSHPNIKTDLSQSHQKFLHGVASSHAKELQSHLDSGNHSKVVNHLRTIMHAHSTPAQAQGHNFFRHTTHTSSAGVQHRVEEPDKMHEHIFKDPKNVSVSSSGTNVHFMYKGKKFASQRFKMESQSDPLSTIKGVGHVY